MSVQHRLTGYDRTTELLTYAHEVPHDRDQAAREIAGVPGSDAEAMGGYPLKPAEARLIARLIGTTIDVDRCDWFYEPVALPLKRAFA